MKTKISPGVGLEEQPPKAVVTSSFDKFLSVQFIYNLFTIFNKSLLVFQGYACYYFVRVYA